MIANAQKGQPGQQARRLGGGRVFSAIATPGRSLLTSTKTRVPVFFDVVNFTTSPPVDSAGEQPHAPNARAAVLRARWSRRRDQPLTGLAKPFFGRQGVLKCLVSGLKI